MPSYGTITNPWLPVRGRCSTAAHHWDNTGSKRARGRARQAAVVGSHASPSVSEVATLGVVRPQMAWAFLAASNQ